MEKLKLIQLIQRLKNPVQAAILPTANAIPGEINPQETNDLLSPEKLKQLQEVSNENQALGQKWNSGTSVFSNKNTGGYDKFTDPTSLDAIPQQVPQPGDVIMPVDPGFEAKRRALELLRK